MKVAVVRFLAVYLLCLIFPLGIWLGLEGYELPSFICIICGWTPVAYYFAMVFAAKLSDEIVE